MKRTHFLAACLFALTLLAGCKEKQTDQFNQYITGFTNGVITSSSSISVYLGQRPDKNYQPGSDLPAGILQFSPAVKGKTVLRDNNSVEFIPEEPFKNGKTYQATFNLGELCQVPASCQKFSFKFDILPLTIVFEPGNLTAEPDNTDELQYQGVLHCSDYTEPTQTEKMLTASYQGGHLTPEWEHNGNRHHFRLRHLKKGESTQTLTLNFSKDIKNNTRQDIKVPGKNDFTVLNVKTSDSEPVVLSIYLSENLEPGQDIRGLVSAPEITLEHFKIHDNVIQAYLPSSTDKSSITLNIFPGIRSVSGITLKTQYTTTVNLRSTKPEVKLIGKGVIVPDKNKVLIPFSAVGLKAVDLEIIQVLQQNMNFFLQENSYDNHSELARTARPIFLKKIDLTENHPDIDLQKWNDFTVDLSKMVKLEKGTIYRFRLKFKKSYTTLPCADEAPDSEYGSTDWDTRRGYAYYSEYNYPAGYQWQERNNPCHVSYYIGERFASRNIINTSLGLMAKQGEDNSYVVCVNDLATAAPVANCKLMLYNYQNQKIDSAQTDKNGFATLHPQGQAFIVTAQKGQDRAWLRLASGNALSLSNFDVSGQQVQMGVKGFIYGERGVWRPGDEIYLSLILEDKLNVLPQGHPIVAQLTDPNGRITQTLRSHTGTNNIHCFTFKTAEDVQTGYWTALFRIGGLTFKKDLRVETVKANRLAIQMEFPNDNIIGKGISETPVKVNTRWLNGASTSNQKAITEVKLYNGNAGFPEFPDYTFTNKSLYFEPATETLFDGTTNGTGAFSFPLDKIKTENAPGILNAIFTTRVFENGGDFSISSQNIRYSPYREYVGIRLPDTEDNWLSTKSPATLKGVIVTPAGKSTGNANIRIDVYRLQWHWWWDSENDNLSSYVNRTYNKSILTKQVKAVNGSFTVNLPIREYGRYFIRATAPSGHSSGVIAYFGSWEENNSQETASMLKLSTNKKSYRVGETIKVTFPSSAGSVALVSLENGKTISNIQRLPAREGTTTFETKATSEMCPNCYVAVSLIQPHDTKNNDRPVRMYGVVNVNVEDPELRLEPVINLPAELRPGKEFTVQVKEKNKKAMNYTIAVVDEGLLSLTSFKTPDPFKAFYAREALGVKTWDFYDYLYGAYGIRLDQAFAIGGDEALKKPQDEKTNRFKPVVIFAGPFTLEAGKTGKHTFKMPEYIGEVRTTVIAATNGSYGAASANSTVNNPLMLSVALPRLLTPGDITDIPVTVFAMQENMGEVKVQMTTDDKITLVGESTQTVRFSRKGEQLVWFKARINQQTGVSTLRTTANAGNEHASVTEDVTIRIPNPRITTVIAKEAKAGESVSFNTPVTGLEPTSVLEISSIPPLNLEQRLTDLLEYPHGCAEQITSQAFPQLSLPALIALTPEQMMTTENNIRTVINRLDRYQTPEGGFAYWPGGTYASEWVTAYVIQFLVSAQQQGYSVPVAMLQNALNYTRQVANRWFRAEPWAQQEQAYRLFVLALAGHPDMAAMNRLKESRLDNPVSQWLLASAYALGRQEEIARNIIRELSTEVASYRETGGNYGSTLRDYALILQSMVILDRQQDAYRMLEKISRSLGSDEWCSTQETAFSLHAAAQFVRKYLGSQKGIQITVTTPQGKQEIRTERTVWQLPLTIENQRSTASVENNGQGNLFVRQINSAASLEVVKEKHLSGLFMEIRYYDDQGKALNIHQLKQGTDVTSEITVKNIGVTGTYQELALSYLVPSGFEIINERLTGNAVMPQAEHTDIRDDRFCVYFSLEQGQAKTFKFRSNAAFRGEYLLPAIYCSAMYDNSIQAILPGGTVKIE